MVKWPRARDEGAVFQQRPQGSRAPREFAKKHRGFTGKQAEESVGTRRSAESKSSLQAESWSKLPTSMATVLCFEWGEWVESQGRLFTVSKFPVETQPTRAQLPGRGRSSATRGTWRLTRKSAHAS